METLSVLATLGFLGFFSLGAFTFFSLATFSGLSSGFTSSTTVSEATTTSSTTSTVSVVEVAIASKQEPTPNQKHHALLQNAKPNLLQNTNTQTANHRKHSRAKISLQLKTLECGTGSNSLGYRKTTKHGNKRGSIGGVTQTTVLNDVKATNLQIKTEPNDEKDHGDTQ